MVPHSIQANLARLRRRERLLTFVWGLACLLTVVLVLLLICAGIDWIIDRERDTPWRVRYAMFLVQIVVAAAAALWFLARPQLRRLPDAALALWVEDKLPHLGHRLISAVQLNQPGARVEGMSVELITLVTREAEREASQVGFAQVADHARLKWSGMLLGPLLLVALIPLLLWPQVAFALLARQALLPIDIPHSVNLESITVEVWPIGDKIPIRYRVQGEFEVAMVGEIVVTPEGQPADRYALDFIEFRTDPATREKYGVFGADVHPSTVNVQYSARLADGRTRLPSEVRLVPRPVIIENLAWVRLPAYVGLKPERDGLGVEQRRYEQPQGRGDVVGIVGSGIRVQVKAQKAITEAWLELLGADKVEPGKSEEEGPLVEIEKGKKAMTIASDGMSAECHFDLAEGLTGYRMVVKDEHRFENVPRPRRSLRLALEDPPQVMLLRDTFGDESTSESSFDVEGLPVILGERIRIPYVCYGPYGLGKSQVMYRVLKKHESGNEPAEEEPWVRLPLPEDSQAGPFNPKTGAFANRTWKQQVPFYAAPSFKPDEDLGRTMGGGRVFLETKGLINSKGLPIELKSGDQIEFCVEIYAMPREPIASTPSARSETRVSTVLRPEEFFSWLQSVGDEDKRLRVLKARQEGVFEAK